MMLYLVFGAAALVLLALLALVWRIWDEYTQYSPEDEERERAIALLNDAQAHRVSDQFLARPPDSDAAWRMMVERGMARPRRRRSRG